MAAADGTLIYLDHQATTPCDPRVIDAMLPYLGARFGNPHSSSHAVGRAAAAAVEAARAEVAALIGAAPEEIVFTSGATEANNLAIKGAARFLRDHPRADRTGEHLAPRRRLLAFATEHKCVLEAVDALGREGFLPQRLPVTADGLPDENALAAALGDDVALVACMAANNEIGTIAPLATVAARAKAAGALVHSDLAQAAGKIPLNVDTLGVDLASMSAHKMYGPMGIGALYVRRRPRVRLTPLVDGGAQERGVRSGTLPLALCVGFGAAAAIAQAEMTAEAIRLARLRDRLLAALRAGIADLTVNGSLEARLPHNLNVVFPGVDAEALMAAVPVLCVSTGSACTSAAVEPSYVLRAMGLSEAQARGSLRIAVGRFTTEADIAEAAALLVTAATRLRRAEAA